MAVVDVKEIMEGRTATDNYKRERSYTRHYRVFTDDPTDEGSIVGAGAGLPVLGDPYPTDAAAVVQEYSVSQEADDPLVWRVSLTYSSVFDLTTAGSEPEDGESGPSGADPGNTESNPTERRTTWRGSSQKVARQVFKDATGAALVNSAGQYFAVPYQKEANQPTIIATKMFANPNFLALSEIVECVNDDVYKGFPAGTLKVDGYDWTWSYESGMSVCTVTTTFVFKKDGWNPVEILDNGYCELKLVFDEEEEEEVLQLVKITDAFGNPLSEPSNLKDGLKWDGAPQFLSFDTYEEADFDTFGY